MEVRPSRRVISAVDADYMV